MQYCVDLIDFVCKILRFTIYFNDFAMKFIRSVSLFDETRVFVTEFIRVTWWLCAKIYRVVCSKRTCFALVTCLRWNLHIVPDWLTQFWSVSLSLFHFSTLILCRCCQFVFCWYYVSIRKHLTTTHPSLIWLLVCAVIYTIYSTCVRNLDPFYSHLSPFLPLNSGSYLNCLFTLPNVSIYASI